MEGSSPKMPPGPAAKDVHSCEHRLFRELSQRTCQGRTPSHAFENSGGVVQCTARDLHGVLDGSEPSPSRGGCRMFSCTRLRACLGPGCPRHPTFALANIALEHARAAVVEQYQWRGRADTLWSHRALKARARFGRGEGARSRCICAPAPSLARDPAALRGILRKVRGSIRPRYSGRDTILFLPVCLLSRGQGQLPTRFQHSRFTELLTLREKRGCDALPDSALCPCPAPSCSVHRGAETDLAASLPWVLARAFPAQAR